MSGWFDKAKAWTSDAASRASEAASKTLEKTKEASQKAKEIAKQKLGRMETAAELTKQLEEKARGASTLTQIAELHRSWIGMMNRKDGGPMYVLAINAETGEEIIPTEVSGELDVTGTAGGAPSAGSSKDVLVLEEVEGGESTVSTDVASGGETGGGAAGTASSGSSSKKKGIFGKISSVVSRKSGSAVEDAKADPNRRLLSFKQVFLRSRALELTMEQLLGDEYMRKRFVQPPPDDHSSHSFYFYSLLQNSLSCPPEIWGGLLRTATEAEILAEFHLQNLTKLFSVLKIDWMDEVFHNERKDMAVRAEQLRNEIRSVKTALPSLTDQEIEKHHKKKVNASRDLVQLYKGLRLNMEDALKHRQTTLQKRDENIKQLEQAMIQYRQELGDTQTSSAETRDALTKDLQSAAELFKSDLDSIDAERVAVDQEIEELELRKKNLKLEIEQVTQLLLAAREKQKKFMQEQDKKRSDMYSEKDNFKRQITEKEQLALHCEVGTKVLTEIHRIVEVTEKQMSASLSKQISELAKKRDQFDQHFVEVLRDHCRYEDDRLVSIGEIAKVSCGRLIRLNDGDESIGGEPAGARDSGKEKGPQLTRAEFLVRERHVFTKATHDLELVWTDITSFRKLHDDIIQSSPILKDLMARMEQKYRGVKQHVAPGLEMMVQASMQGPDSPAGGTIMSLQPTTPEPPAAAPSPPPASVPPAAAPVVEAAAPAPPPPPPAPPVAAPIVEEVKEEPAPPPAPPAPAAPSAPVEEAPTPAADKGSPGASVAAEAPAAVSEEQAKKNEDGDDDFAIA